MNNGEGKRPGGAKGPRAADKRAERRVRAGRALRANLGRRKAQARQRRDSAARPPPKSPGAE
ncbi:MAG: hypothetical protein O7D27_06060 [Alphaproteobacteria bacterium]|nr:hypothetical protein [Alphaproteobacteria bacterium]